MAAYLENYDKGLLKVGTETVVGRREGNHTFPDDKSMSTKHFKMVTKDDKYFIEDLGSKNGTKLNGQQINANRQYLVVEGATIEAGDQIFKFINVKK